MVLFGRWASPSSLVTDGLSSLPNGLSIQHKYMSCPQLVPNPRESNTQLPPKIHEDSPPARLPSLSVVRNPYHILDALRQALPDLGESIARAHYHHTIAPHYSEPHHEQAKGNIALLASDSDSVISHEPRWHEFGIVTHTEKVIDVALTKWHRIDNDSCDLAWAIDDLKSRTIDGMPLFELLVISLALHDIGKFQPLIKSGKADNTDRISHVGHEARGGDLIRAARSTQPPEELSALATIFESFAITDCQLDYIERCVRLHFEFGKVRHHASQTDYSVAYTRTPAFKQVCLNIATEHKGLFRESDMSIEKGVLFLMDSAGKTNFTVQNEGNESAWANHVQEIGAHPKLLHAYKQYAVHLAVGLQYLAMLRASWTSSSLHTASQLFSSV
jgi:hypothetical protein